MTDKARLIKLLDDFGISWSHREKDYPAYKPDENFVYIREGDDGVVGYGGFYCWYEFGVDGSFVECGVAE